MQTLLILPVGTTEEHGPHLPVDTDARIAEAWGTRLAAVLTAEIPVLLMNTICYGYSMKIMRQWPGTIVVRSRVLMDMVLDICTSVLDMGFEKLVILDCHGHQAGPLNTVSREISDACKRQSLSSAQPRSPAMNSMRSESQPREVPITPERGRLLWCFRSVQKLWTCRKLPPRMQCAITPNSSRATTSRGASASRGRGGTFKAARPEPTVILPSLAARRAESS